MDSNHFMCIVVCRKNSGAGVSFSRPDDAQFFCGTKFWRGVGEKISCMSCLSTNSLES